MMNFTKTTESTAEVRANNGIYTNELTGWALHTRVGWIAEVEVREYREDYVPAPIYTGKCKRAASAEEAIRKACYEITRATRKVDVETYELVKQVRMALK